MNNKIIAAAAGIVAFTAASAADAAYVGPGDVVPGSYGWWGIWAYTNALATANATAVYVQRASDSTNTAVPLCGNGTLNTPIANAFAGTDAVVTATASTTTLTVTGVTSGTLHVGDSLTGVGITQPAFILSFGTGSGGIGTYNLNQSQTIASAEAITAQVALTVYKAVDQTVSGLDLTTPGGSVQPAFLPDCGNNHHPCFAYAGNNNQLLSTSSFSSGQTQPFSASFIAERTNNFFDYNDVLESVNGGLLFDFGFNGFQDEALLYNGNVQNAPAADNVVHAIQEVANGASSVINVDGTDNSVGDPGSTPITGTNISIMGAENQPLEGYFYEAGFFGNPSSSFGLTSGQRSLLATNAATRLSKPWVCGAGSIPQSGSSIIQSTTMEQKRQIRGRE